jgi:glyoxylase-like metal-dependent hydrolase (beta-lactamase superfamily II)
MPSQLLPGEESKMARQPDIISEFESTTGTWQYIVADPATSKAIIIDPVLNFDPATNTLTTETADALLSIVQQRGYHVERIMETHAHADHLTASSYLQSRLAQTQTEAHRPLIGIGKRIKQVQELFGQRYGVPAAEYENVFDTLFDDDESFSVGDIPVTTMHLPGHTPDHLGYQMGGKQFELQELRHTVF